MKFTRQRPGGAVAPGPPQTYGVVPAGGGPVARTFTFTADPALACGAALTATLTLQDNVNDLGTLTYPFTLGRLSAGSFAITYGTGDVAVAIPDAGSVTIPITVPPGGDVISDVNVRVRLNHTFDGDVVMALVHPDGTTRRMTSLIASFEMRPFGSHAATAVAGVNLAGFRSAATPRRHDPGTSKGTARWSLNTAPPEREAEAAGRPSASVIPSNVSSSRSPGGPSCAARSPGRPQWEPRRRPRSWPRAASLATAPSIRTRR